MLTQHLAKEYGPRGVRFNCVAPSMIRNERIEQHLDIDAIAQIGRGFPLGRIGEPRDVAEAIAFLAGDASGWTTGTVLEVTGGKTL
jgi:3-oxoacyl-[acyl-carrier protein] reductase